MAIKGGIAEELIKFWKVGVKVRGLDLLLGSNDTVVEVSGMPCSEHCQVAVTLLFTP